LVRRLTGLKKKVHLKGSVIRDEEYSRNLSNPEKVGDPLSPLKLSVESWFGENPEQGLHLPKQIVRSSGGFGIQGRGKQVGREKVTQRSLKVVEGTTSGDKNK